MAHLQLAPGTLFANRFEIECTAGRGGMGTVYRAYDRYSGDVIALKLLHNEANEPSEADRFTREAQLLAELRHPAIVTYIAHGGTPDGQRFLAMEWLEGHDLGQRLARGPLWLHETMQVAQRTAEALTLAHRRGIVHRDRSHKHKICLQQSHRACHHRRTDDGSAHQERLTRSVRNLCEINEEILKGLGVQLVALGTASIPLSGRPVSS